MHLLAHLLAASASCSLVWAQSIQQATPPVEGYTYIGCYTDSAASRGLTDNSQDNPQSNDATACAAFCGGSTYFGLEFSSQCFCGNTLGPTSVQANEANCMDYSCPGDDNYYCGGTNFFAVYKVNEATGSTPAAPAIVTQSATCAAASISTVTVTLTPSVATTSKSPYTTVTFIIPYIYTETFVFSTNYQLTCTNFNQATTTATTTKTATLAGPSSPLTSTSSVKATSTAKHGKWRR